MRLSSFGLYLLLIGTGVATPKNFNNVKRQPPGPPPPPPPPPTTWKPDKLKPKPLVDPPKAKLLYRGEYFRGPEDVKKVNGFDSHAKRIFEGKHPDYKNGMNTELFKKGSSLYEHAVFKNPVSSYVPTSWAMEEALKFAKSADKTGYLYKIRSSPDMVDVVGSLGGEDYFKHFKEQEVAGVYDIPWHQVESWQEVKRSAQTGEYEIGKEMPNKDFDEPPIGEPSYATHRELAGWPEGAVAWEHEAWAPYKNEPVEGMLNEHLLRYRHKNNMEEFKKSRGSEEWAMLPCSGSRKRAGGTNACALIREELVKVPGGEGKLAIDRVDSDELAALAKQNSKEAFNDLLTEFNYGSVAKQDQLFHELDSRLPELSSLSRSDRIINFSAKIGEGALLAGGLALYGKTIADVFQSDTSTALDKAAAVTSIIPGIGCAVQLADDAQKGRVDAVHTSLCFVEDALMVTGFWEVAVVMQIGEEFANWIRAEMEQLRLYDGHLLEQKGAEAWLTNVQRLVSHIKSDEFFANATTKFSTYQLLVLYQASQLTGDLHASHKAISDKANKQPDQSVNVAAQIKPELKRQICVAMAESKYQLQKKLESVALDHVAKLEKNFKKQFLDDWWAAATRNIPIFGIKLPETSHGHLAEDIENARKTPLNHYEDEIKNAIRMVVERLQTPDPCTCIHEWGSKDGGRKTLKCEFGVCGSTEREKWKKDAGKRYPVGKMKSIDHGRRRGLPESCIALFTTCQDPGSTQETGRTMLCVSKSDWPLVGSM